MLLLVNTTDKLQAVTSAATAVDVVCTYMDASTAAPPVVGGSTSGRQLTAISSATTTDILAAPGASTLRTLRTCSIRNKDTATSNDVTVRYNANGTTYEMIKVTLTAGSTLEYASELGWYVVSASNPTVKALAADQSNSTSTPTEVAGLSLNTGVGAFAFRYYIVYQSAATTTGVRFSVNHAGTVTQFVYNWHVVDNTATASTAAADQDAVAAAAQVYSAFAARAKSVAGTGTTISVDTANADMLAIIEGAGVCTVDGELELWHGSEVAAASTVKAGSVVQIIKP